MVSLEDAGFEIRDCLMWLYGEGFPKSFNIGSAISGNGSNARAVQAVKSIAKEARRWNGYGTALKPAWEPIILAMKPTDGTFAQNALAWEIAGLNLDRCRTDFRPRFDPPSANGRQLRNGRLPANFLPGDDVAAWLDKCNPTAKSRRRVLKGGSRINGGRTMGAFYNRRGEMPGGYDDTGGPSRFFYCPKASRKERDAGLDTPNIHPCIKPLSLCEYVTVHAPGTNEGVGWWVR